MTDQRPECSRFAMLGRWLIPSKSPECNKFLLMHAVQGWCPPIPVLRRFGVRTTFEIDRERNALKALRGDYREMVHYRERDSQKAMEAVDR